MKNVCTDDPLTVFLLFYIPQEQLFTIFLVTFFAVFPCDQGMDVGGDSFFDVMKVVRENRFVAVDAHGGKLRMSGDQTCFKIVFHHLSSLLYSHVLVLKPSGVSRHRICVLGLSISNSIPRKIFHTCGGNDCLP